MEEAKEERNKFLSVCREVTDNDADVINLFKKYFRRTDISYLTSSDFRKSLRKTQDKLKTDQKNKYVHLKKLMELLKSQKDPKYRKRHSDTDSSVSDSKRPKLIGSESKDLLCTESNKETDRRHSGCSSATTVDPVREESSVLHKCHLEGDGNKDIASSASAGLSVVNIDVFTESSDSQPSRKSPSIIEQTETHLKQADTISCTEGDTKQILPAQDETTCIRTDANGSGNVSESAKDHGRQVVNIQGAEEKDSKSKDRPHDNISVETSAGPSELVKRTSRSEVLDETSTGGSTEHGSRLQQAQGKAVNQRCESQGEEGSAACQSEYMKHSSRTKCISPDIFSLQEFMAENKQLTFADEVALSGDTFVPMVNKSCIDNTVLSKELEEGQGDVETLSASQEIITCRLDSVHKKAAQSLHHVNFSDVSQSRSGAVIEIDVADQPILADGDTDLTGAPGTSREAFHSDAQEEEAENWMHIPLSQSEDENDEEQDRKTQEQKEESKEETTPRHCSRRQLQKLEKLLEMLKRKINEEEEKELTLEELEHEDTAYTREHLYKKKFVQVWTKYCQVTGRPPTTGRPTERKFRFQGTRYQEVDKMIERFINSKKIFPDYQDIRNCIVYCNKKYNLQLKRPAIDTLAREAFVLVGNELQKRRQLDDSVILNSVVTGPIRPYDDPALVDRELNRKLQSNKNTYKSRMDDVLNKYARMQELRDNDDEEDDDEDDDEDDEDEQEEGEEEDETGGGDGVIIVEDEDAEEEREDTKDPADGKDGIEDIQLAASLLNSHHCDSRHSPALMGEPRLSIRPQESTYGKVERKSDGRTVVPCSVVLEPIPRYVQKQRISTAKRSTAEKQSRDENSCSIKPMELSEKGIGSRGGGVSYRIIDSTIEEKFEQNLPESVPNAPLANKHRDEGTDENQGNLTYKVIASSFTKADLPAPSIDSSQEASSQDSSFDLFLGSEEASKVSPTEKPLSTKDKQIDENSVLETDRDNVNPSYKESDSLSTEADPPVYSINSSQETNTQDDSPDILTEPDKGGEGTPAADPLSPNERQIEETNVVDLLDSPSKPHQNDDKLLPTGPSNREKCPNSTRSTQKYEEKNGLLTSATKSAQDVLQTTQISKVNVTKTECAQQKCSAGPKSSENISQKEGCCSTASKPTDAASSRSSKSASPQPKQQRAGSTNTSSRTKYIEIKDDSGSEAATIDLTTPEKKACVEVVETLKKAFARSSFQDHVSKTFRDVLKKSEERYKGVNSNATSQNMKTHSDVLNECSATKARCRKEGQEGWLSKPSGKISEVSFQQPLATEPHLTSTPARGREASCQGSVKSTFSRRSPVNQNVPHSESPQNEGLHILSYSSLTTGETVKQSNNEKGSSDVTRRKHLPTSVPSDTAQNKVSQESAIRTHSVSTSSSAGNLSRDRDCCVHTETNSLLPQRCSNTIESIEETDVPSFSGRAFISQVSRGPEALRAAGGQVPGIARGDFISEITQVAAQQAMQASRKKLKQSAPPTRGRPQPGGFIHNAPGVHKGPRMTELARKNAESLRQAHQSSNRFTPRMGQGQQQNRRHQRPMHDGLPGNSATVHRGSASMPHSHAVSNRHAYSAGAQPPQHGSHRPFLGHIIPQQDRRSRGEVSRSSHQSLTNPKLPQDIEAQCVILSDSD